MYCPLYSFHEPPVLRGIPLYIVLCTIYCVLSPVLHGWTSCTPGYPPVLCTVYCVLCTVYCVLCTVPSTAWMNLPYSEVSPCTVYYVGTVPCTTWMNLLYSEVSPSIVYYELFTVNCPLYCLEKPPALEGIPLYCVLSPVLPGWTSCTLVYPLGAPSGPFPLCPAP